jgi:O-6-methylguanine DNA methyltransferase
LSAGLAVGEVAGWGWCGVAASQDGLVAARGDMDSEAAVRAGLEGDLPQDIMPDDGLAEAGLEYLKAILLGETRELPRLDARGTGFEMQVWKVLGSVRRGHTISYGEIAERLGLDAGSARAVGGAVGANPLWVIVPCHRAVGSDGSLTGYAGGLDLKRKLLNSEAMALIS